MACWRVLHLTERLDNEYIPQLLIKPRFEKDAYTVFLTDLTNIWSEELDLSGIVGRAAEEESPIEVSKRDTTQLAILLQNVRNSLASSADTSCCITRSHTDDVTLHTTISLPEPLDSLAWKFHLRKRTAVTLKNELILPLLVSSRIQHDRVNSLTSTIAEKDRAITRLLDQYESSNLDLAAAFPSIGGLKSGRRLVKREQVARHVPSLQPFDHQSWKRETARLHDTDVSTLGLFQEALSECNPRVPPQLLAEAEACAWWSMIGTKYTAPTASSRSKAKPGPELPMKPVAAESETEEEETEDEFEVHEHFKSRQVPTTSGPARPISVHASKTSRFAESESEDEEEDDDDLDAPPKSQSQGQSRIRGLPPLETSARPESLSPHREKTRSPTISSPRSNVPSSAPRPKGKGFWIGGKATKPETATPAQDDAQGRASGNRQDADSMPSRVRPGDEATELRGVRQGFRIGGRGKAPGADTEHRRGAEVSMGNGDDVAESKSRTAERSRLALAPARPVKETTPDDEEREETAEEKAERKRRELKRKNEEAAKKLAQSKKKKRF